MLRCYTIGITFLVLFIILVIFLLSYTVSKVNFFIHVEIKFVITRLEIDFGWTIKRVIEM